MSSKLSRAVAQDFGVLYENKRWMKSKAHDSLVVDKQRELFYWNSCGLVGNLYTYLTKVRNYSPEMAKKEMNGILLDLDYKPKEITTPIVDAKLVDIFFENGKNNRDYFYRRNLTDDIIDTYKLGFYNDWYTIPIFENSVVLNFQLRRDIPEKKIKHLYRGVGQTIYNADILSFVDTVFITEGAIDALNLIQVGLPAVSIMSGIILPKFIYKFAHLKKIYILFDNDKAGISEAIRNAQRLGEERCLIYCFQNFEKPTYDPVDFFRDGHTKQELLELISLKAKKSYEMSNV